MSASQELLEAREALSALLDRLDEVEGDPSWRAVWSMAWAHGVRYTGPSWKEPYLAARGLLAKSTTGDTVE